MKHKELLIEYIQQSMHPVYQQVTIDAIQPALKINYKLNEVPLVGASKLGGCPDLPKELDWPVDKKGIPYLFLAQINLREIEAYDLVDTMVGNGVLYFFAQANYPYTHEVLYSDKDQAEMCPRSAPIVAQKKTFWSFLFKQENYFKLYPSSSIFFEKIYTIPFYATLYYSKLELEGRLKKVEEVIADEHIYFETLFDDKIVQHQLFGDYRVVQNERIESDLEGFEGSFKTLKKEDLPAIKASMEWILLLQLEADNALEFYFGDAGKTYFFIKKQDLLKGDFSNIKGYWDTH